MKLYLVSFALILFSTFSLQGQEARIDSTAANHSSGYVETIVDWYMQNMNYGTITLLMTIESSFIPFPSEVVIPPAAYKACQADSSLDLFNGNTPLNIAMVVLFGTIGAIIGALINYFLALWLGRPIVYKFVESRIGKMCLLSREKVEKAEDYFVKHGKTSTFIGRLVPGIRQLISIPAGLAQMPLFPFIVYTALGAGIWNLVLAVLGYFLHGQQELITTYSKELSYGIGLLAVLFILYIIYNGFKKKK